MSTARPSACSTAVGWNKPQPDQYPTGAELVEQYLEPLATRTALKDRIRTSSRVTSVGRVGFDKVKTKGREAAPFEIRYQNGKGPETLRADAVIDATGTWFAPNPAGADGLPAIGEGEARIRASPTACPTCWAAIARAMPARPSPCWAPAIRRSAR